ncbi:MAG: OstA-like protein [Candidatus Cryptobacteroides sp.]
MGRKSQKIIPFLFAAAVAAIPISAQNDGRKENMVRLLQGKSVQIITDEEGRTYRKAVDATFLHNDTYLICDTAYWRVDDNIINAKGNVQLMQEGTVLTSETLDYYVDDDLAQFRGGVVQLLDKENNTLRTRFLDYNTADSIAVFFQGASMKDKDGQIIESINGTYNSKAKLFTFSGDVNMFTDSVFIKTTVLDYHTDTERAVFSAPTDFWKDDNMLSAEKGWYDRGSETFFFTGKVHATSQNQETWSDSLYYYRNLNNVLLLGNAQMQDSTHRTSALAEYIYYEDSLAQVTMRRKAAVAVVTEENEKTDTLYFGADTLIYYTLRMCDIPESEIRNAQTRLSDILTDPVGEYRKKAAEEAAKKAEEAAKRKEMEERGGAVVPGGDKAPARGLGKGLGDDEFNEAPMVKPKKEEAPADSTALKAPADSAAMKSPADSTALKAPADSTLTTAPADSVAAAPEPPKDTTKVGFAIGLGNVRIFRSDLQVRCDSMRYCDLDSIARFYKDPIIWNEENRQFFSDSLAVLVKESRADRASLMSEAFVVTQEDSLLYDQIKGAEIIAFFDTTSALKRFDALGGATTLFYLEENGKLATVNKVECKMLSGNFKDGKLDRMHYYDQPKNDAYPVVQFPKEDRYFKGFRWNPELRPTGKEDITTLQVRPSERAEYAKKPKAVYKQTDIYFPGYMKGVYASIDARREAERRAAQRKKHEEQMQKLDSLALSDSLALKDSLALADSTAIKDSLAHSDSLALKDSTALSDSLAVAAADSLKNLPKTKQQLREERRQARQKAREARIAAREARWAELDRKDAEKAELKRQKELKRKREKTRRALIAQQKQDLKDEQTLQHYIEYYQKKKAKEDGKVSGEIPAIRRSGHPVERGVPEPAEHQQTAELAETAVQ